MANKLILKWLTSLFIREKKIETKALSEWLRLKRLTIPRIEQDKENWNSRIAGGTVNLRSHFGKLAEFTKAKQRSALSHSNSISRCIF